MSSMDTAAGRRTPPALRDRGGGGTGAGGHGAGRAAQSGRGRGGLGRPVGRIDAGHGRQVIALGECGLDDARGLQLHRRPRRAVAGLRHRGVPAHGTISINWAGRDKDDGVPFTAVLANLKKDQRLTSGKLTIPMPFARDAQVTGGRLAVAQGGVKSKDEGVTFESRTYWSAYKIGP